MKRKIMSVLLLIFMITPVYASSMVKKVNVTYRDITVEHNGITQNISKEPFILDGTTYVSIRDISNIFNEDISWNPSKNLISLSSRNNNDDEVDSLKKEIESLKEQIEYYKNLLESNNTPKPDLPADTPNTPSEPDSPEVDSPVIIDSQIQFEDEVLRLVNIERKKEGLSELVMDDELRRVARIKSKDMKENNYFSHMSPTYGSPFDMLTKFEIQYMSAGENIARGQTTPEEVMNSWMNSSGHRSNILNSNFTKIGIGLEPNTYHWTQLFIG